jgi:hypothetical protein
MEHYVAAVVIRKQMLYISSCEPGLGQGGFHRVKIKAGDLP